jgi:hypothetical protein
MAKLLRALCAASVIALVSAPAGCNDDDSPSTTLGAEQKVVVDKQRARKVGGRTFHGRGLRRCVRRTGARAATAKPYPGDRNAPDLELVVSGRVRAFVGLYTDAARARANLPAIRRDAKQGTVEAMRRATIVWVSQPDAAVRRCVARARP